MVDWFNHIILLCTTVAATMRAFERKSTQAISHCKQSIKLYSKGIETFLSLGINILDPTLGSGVQLSLENIFEYLRVFKCIFMLNILRFLKESNWKVFGFIEKVWNILQKEKIRVFVLEKVEWKHALAPNIKVTCPHVPASYPLIRIWVQASNTWC